MKYFGRSRAAVFLPLFLLCMAACAQGDGSAKEFLSHLYQGYQSSQQVNYLGDAADTVFASELLSLIRKGQKRADGEMGVLDHDPICDCQDYEISDVRIKIGKAKEAGAVADVQFKNGGSEVKLALTLSPMGKGWRIADIKSSSIPSLLQLLRENSTPRPGGK